MNSQPSSLPHSEPTREQRIARLYRMLFRYETDPEGDWAPAYLSTMGQADCLWAIRRLEAMDENEHFAVG